MPVTQEPGKRSLPLPPLRGRAVTILVVVALAANVVLIGSATVDKRAVYAHSRTLVPKGATPTEIVRQLAAYVRDHVHHCNLAEVEAMPWYLRWNYRYNPFRIGPKTALDHGGEPDGACGSSVRVSMELLAAHGIDSRIVMLLDANLVSWHVLLEVNYEGAWGVVDPLYNIVYTHPDGRPASALEIRDDEALFLANASTGWAHGYGPARAEHRTPYNWQKNAFTNPQHFNYGKLGPVTKAAYHILHAGFGEEGPRWIRRPNFYAYPTLTAAVAGDTALAALLIGYAAVRRLRRKPPTAAYGYAVLAAPAN